jgi:hypothetical protein
MQLGKGRYLRRSGALERGIDGGKDFAKAVLDAHVNDAAPECLRRIQECVQWLVSMKSRLKIRAGASNERLYLLEGLIDQHRPRIAEVVDHHPRDMIDLKRTNCQDRRCQQR